MTLWGLSSIALVPCKAAGSLSLVHGSLKCKKRKRKRIWKPASLALSSVFDLAKSWGGIVCNCLLVMSTHRAILVARSNTVIKLGDIHWSDQATCRWKLRRCANAWLRVMLCQAVLRISRVSITDRNRSENWAFRNAPAFAFEYFFLPLIKLFALKWSHECLIVWIINVQQKRYVGA